MKGRLFLPALLVTLIARDGFERIVPCRDSRGKRSYPYICQLSSGPHVSVRSDGKVGKEVGSGQRKSGS